MVGFCLQSYGGRSMVEVFLFAYFFGIDEHFFLLLVPHNPPPNKKKTGCKTNKLGKVARYVDLVFFTTFHPLKIGWL